MPRQKPTAEENARQQLSAWLKSQPNAGAFTIGTLEDQRTLVWPATRRQEQVFLFNVERAGQAEIGLAGPAAYQFFGLAYNGYSLNDLYALFAGWHACLSLLQNPHVEGGNLVGETADIAVVLRDSGYSGLQLTEAVHIGGRVECAFKLEAHGQTKVWLGTVDGGELFDAALPVMRRPLYWHIGRQLLAASGF